MPFHKLKPYGKSVIIALLWRRALPSLALLSPCEVCLLTSVALVTAIINHPCFINPSS